MRPLLLNRLNCAHFAQSTVEMVALLLFLHLHYPTSCSAVEKWADSHLSIVDGLEIWLDASRLPGTTSSRVETGSGPRTRTGSAIVIFDLLPRDEC